MQSIDIKMADDDDDDDESDDVQAACARGTTRTKQPWAERWLLSGLRLKRRRARCRCDGSTRGAKKYMPISNSMPLRPSAQSSRINSLVHHRPFLRCMARSLPMTIPVPTSRVLAESSVASRFSVSSLPTKQGLGRQY